MSKRKCLCLSDKVKLLEDVDKGMKKKDVAIKYSIAASSVSTILKNRSAIIEHESSVNVDRKRVKQCSYENVDTVVLKWVTMIRDKNLPLSGPMIQQKALDFAKDLGHSNFQASVGWLDKFKKRHGISYKTISGESADVSEEVCEKWKKEASKLLKEYPAKDIFNADETGLFFFLSVYRIKL